MRSFGTSDDILYRVETSDDIMYRAATVFQDWTCAQNACMQDGADHQDIPHDIIWSKPPPGFMKGNVEAAFFKEEGKTGFVFVLRDDTGAFMSARVSYLLPVREGETTGLLALKWMEDLGFNHVMYELDIKLNLIEGLFGKQRIFA